MRKSTHMILAASAVAAILSAGIIAPQIASAASASDIEEGKKLAEDRKLGNCLACHAMAGGNLPGNIGPPLVNMKSRYNEQTMFDQIWDATKKNPNTMMPPFGKHRVLTDDQIRKISAYILTL